MAIMDIFKSFSPAAPAASTTAATGTTAATQATTEQSTQQGDQQQQQQVTSPLDKFSKLHDNDNNSADSAPQDTSIFGEIDPKKVMENAGKVNFLQVVSQDDVKAVQAGGEDATKALARILQTVAAAGYGQSSLTSAQLIEEASKKLEQKFLSKLPGQVRNTLVDNNLLTTNAAFAHPAVAPLVEIAKTQFIAQHPDATPQQITEMTTEYMKAVAGAFGDQQTQQDTGSVQDTDWFKELGIEAT